MPVPIPVPVAADSTGLADSQWIADVRDALRDYPDPVNGSWPADGVSGVFAAAAAPLKLDKGPIYDGTPIANYVLVSDTTAPATNYTVVAAPTLPGAGQVQINYNARTLTFATPPTNGHTIAVGYYTCKWTDYSIETALYAGLREMFPSVGKTYTDSQTSIAVNTWDYTLPLWAQSPDAQITRVEYQDPAIATEPWRPLPIWERRGIDLLHVPRAGSLSPVAKLRITGWGPYLALADLEPDLYHLPIWYALHVLNAKQESKRIREDTMVPLTAEGGQTAGLLMQAGLNYKNLFDATLKQKARAYGPPGMSRPILTTYQLARHI